MKLKKSARFIAAFFFILNPAFVFSEKISFSANSMSGTIGEKSDSTTLSGEASVITESMEIYADSITMTGEDYRYIEAKGSIKGVNVEAELDFTCEKLKFDRETKVAELSDNVTLKDTKNDVEAKAQIIRYNQETDVAVMQIDIELKQKENVCSGAYAVYRKKDQMLELSGNAQIKHGTDTFRAQEIFLNLDSQEITLDGRVKGSIVDEHKSEEPKRAEKDAEKSSETPNETKKDLEKSESKGKAKTPSGNEVESGNKVENAEKNPSEKEKLDSEQNNAVIQDSPEKSEKSSVNSSKRKKTSDGSFKNGKVK